MVDGVFVHMPIDSYVPVNSTDRKELFSHNYKGSIFPCIYEKLLAKVYGTMSQSPLSSWISSSCRPFIAGRKSR